MQRGMALWYISPGKLALRPFAIREPLDGEVLVRACFSGISRGTERLVLGGQVPESEHLRMRCQGQEGAFPFPVKYGYALAGRIERGPPERIGQPVFVLHPHQDYACVPSEAAITLPADLPLRRAVLTANTETALNILWDGAAMPGDRVAVIGGGVLGLLVAGIAARIPGCEVTVVDVEAARAPVAAALGARFATPDQAPRDQDLVIHTSASENGLRLALACAALEARIVEASWYGTKPVALALGENFHSKRLRLVSSQVGRVPASHQARWPRQRRLAAALALLKDSRFDRLISGELAFEEAPAQLPGLLAEGAPGLMTALRYG
jgi:NADPH:quinone reductase-like Zn-dependent oxidoreductase